MVPVRKRERWLWNLGQIAVDAWDIPKGESIFWDGKNKMLSQEGHLQYRYLVLSKEGLDQTSWKQPLGDPDSKEVLHQGVWRAEVTIAAPGLGKRPVGMKRRNWNVLALKRANEGYEPLTRPTLISFIVHSTSPAHRTTKMTPIDDPKWSHRPRTALLPRNSP